MNIYALYNSENDTYVGQDFVEFQETSETILRPVDSINRQRTVLCTNDRKYLESLLSVAESVYQWNCYGNMLVDFYCEVENLENYSIVQLTPKI